MPATIRDRSSEFHACCESLQQRNNLGSRLLPKSPTSSKSEFAKAASQIAREINTTMAKLHSLTALAKKKSLFDDSPQQVNELTQSIRADISKINKNISLLQNHQRAQIQNGASPKQVADHAAAVVTSLQTRLASTSTEFKTVLEVRTQNLKDQKSRRDQYSFTPSASAGPSTPSASSSATAFQQSASVPFAPAAPGGGAAPLNRDSVIDMEGIGGHQQLAMQNNNAATMEYIDSRGQAIDTIESTIAELGQIYSQFTQILAQQREMVQRIDMNVMDTEVNVTNAHSELARYLERLQGNRWLMIQVFGILVVFFMLFVVIS
ncbi:t-SNARE [Chytriomyces sp. MP71]|nr:t-SNARE [Chytriomyces sp. MP71]